MKLPDFAAVKLLHLRSYLFTLSQQPRYVNMKERFILFSTPIFTIGANATLRFNTVQGFTNDIVLTHLFPNINVLGVNVTSFTFNFQVTSSQEWYFSTPVWTPVFFNGSYPIIFPRPILLKTGSGLTFEFTDISTIGSMNQLIFGGYKTEAKEV